MYLPLARLGMKVAIPLESSVTVPNAVVPLLNVTVPVGVPLFAGVTVAVRVVLPFAARLV